MRCWYFAVFAFLCACGIAPTRPTKQLDSLLLVSDVSELRTKYGRENVKPLPPGSDEWGPSQSAILFPGTRQAARLTWYEIPRDSGRHELIRTVSHEDEAAVSDKGFDWATATGAISHLSLKDVEEWTGQAFPLTIAPDKESLMTKELPIPKSNDRFDLMSVRVTFDPKFQFSSGVPTKAYYSGHDEAQASNPNVHQIRLMASIGARPSASPYPVMPHKPDSELLVEFLQSTIRMARRGLMPKLTFPYSQYPDVSRRGVYVGGVPESFFSREECWERHAGVIGYYPDTSRYFLVVWEVQGKMRDAFQAEKIPSVYITTLAKDGTLKGKTRSLYNANYAGPPGCSVHRLVTLGMIQEDLTFFSEQSRDYTCEGNPIVHETVRLQGYVRPDGTLEVKEERPDQ